MSTLNIYTQFQNVKATKKEKDVENRISGERNY